MNRVHIDIAVIGGGCAGMSAALAAKKNGAANIVIFERNPYLGGVLRQCIHNGFGIHHFGEDLTGTQYSRRLSDSVAGADIRCLTETTVLGVSKNRIVTAINRCDGLTEYAADAVILATGCRERARGALMIPGSRPAGVVTAGTAQRYMNIEGYLVGKKILILGSGDIGLIMARQFVLEGAEVIAIAEVMPYSGGLMRNIVQCVEDFNIPLYYNTTVTRIIGDKRIEGAYLASVDENRLPIASTERFVACDTLVLSVGLIPENELAFDAGVAISPSTGGPLVDDLLQTELDGIFVCGNALHVHDLVDFVSSESEYAGKSAAQYVAKGQRNKSGDAVDVVCGPGVRGLVPQRINLNGEDDTVRLQFRPADKYYDCRIVIRSGEAVIAQKKYRVLTPGEMCEMLIHRADVKDPVRVQVES
jgi:NADPH-dependent 2,4-dienoyl-CoA reductase/sulfur reductase-like enzyme